MGAVMGESCGPCSWAAGPWAAPSTGSRSKAHERSRSAPRAYRLSDAGRRAWRVGSSVPAAPIPRRSGRWDNEDHGDQTPHGVQLSTSGAPFANRAPFSESQPILRTQLLSGSALRINNNAFFAPDLAECQGDEVAHRNEADAACVGSPPGFMLRVWCALVGGGLRCAVAVCRHI